MGENEYLHQVYFCILLDDMQLLEGVDRASAPAVADEEHTMDLAQQWRVTLTEGCLAAGLYYLNSDRLAPRKLNLRTFSQVLVELFQSFRLLVRDRHRLLECLLK